MEKHLFKSLFIGTVCAAIIAAAGTVWATEPSMADYTSYPVFMSGQIPPNIMVMLDNSGSMNYNAYGSWPGNLNVVTDEPYQFGGTFEFRVYDPMDDAEETFANSNSYYSNGDLDLGYQNWDAATGTGTTPAYVGVRFQNLNIPKGAQILSAYIEFRASADSTSLPAETSFVIKGEANDHAETFVNASAGISGRPTTTASVTWSDVPAWIANTAYQTPDVKDILQEIVDRDGWNSGQAMAFVITGSGKRDARPRDNGYDYGPRLYVDYIGGDRQYYGYFDPTARYSYSSSIFQRDAAGDWSGNFLNWLTMRRIDVARKVLMGGLANPRTYSGTQKLSGHSAPAGYNYAKEYDGNNIYDDSGGKGVTPYKGVYTYVMNGDEFGVYTSGAKKATATYQIVIEKVAADEPQDFEYISDATGSGLTTVGVFQRYGKTGRWGNMWYNKDGSNYTTNGNGGVISNGITDKVTSSFLNDLQNTAPTTWTPLAESMYTAAQYFAQLGIDGTLNYSNNPGTTANDPFDGSAPCAKNFVLLITDGASTQDATIPSALKNYADSYDTFVTTDKDSCDEKNSCKYGSGGTDYLKDVALWARTTDLRSASYGKNAIEGDQNIYLYAVYAFGNEDSARELLKEAAKNGGFEDRNGNNRPDGGKDDPADSRVEWDKDGNGIPDTYFEASDGRNLEEQLGKAISAMLERASSGTASSVLATNSEGEATLLQAYFRPKVYVSGKEVEWTGYLQSLWVDRCGNLREDTDGDLKLDLGSDTEAPDLIVEYFYDSEKNETVAQRYSSHPNYSNSSSCSQDTSGAVATQIDMDDVKPLFEAGKVLAQTNATDRHIFTFIDQDGDSVVDEASYGNFDSAGELIAFDPANAALLDPYLGVENATNYDYLGSSHSDRIDNLINYIRGVDLFDSTGKPVLRPRTMEVDGTNQVWKLGDIIHSTPVSVSKPVDNYNVIYADESYQTYYDDVKDRETLVLVGGNDGMLHAFTSWKYDSANHQYIKPDAAGDDEKIGQELWAYIPQTLLPHLKWLADPNYTHVYYADLQPKVVDAQILPDTDGDGTAEWGTFLLLGLNMGGKQIWTNEFGASGTDTRYFNPSYTCINITDPRNPVVMWERAYTGLGLGTSIPAVIKMGDKWMAVIGSGPTDYDGTSSQKAHVYVVDLKTGAPATAGANDWLYELAEDNAFLNSPVSVDAGLNYNVDGIYLGETYCESSCTDPLNFNIGMVYKIPVPCSPCQWDSDGSTTVDPVYVEDPTAWPQPSVLLKSDNTFQIPPITGTMSLSADKKDNIWVYFGTGRFIDTVDKTTTQQNYLYGVKDPFFNKRHSDANSNLCTDCYHNYSKSLTLTPSDLFDAESVFVTTGGKVFNSSNSTLYGKYGEWSELITDVRLKEGWLRSLDISVSSPSERVISKPGVLGGIVLVPTFIPNPDECGFGGITNFYAVYYETGTAYKNHIFTTPNPQTISLDGKTLEVVDYKLDKTIISSPPPKIGIHAGRQKGATAFVQVSSGEIVEINFDTALPIRSNLVNWRLKE